MCSFYMFLSAIFVYIKLKSGTTTVDYAEAGYMLLYYSLVVISLYQDKKMLLSITAKKMQALQKKSCKPHKILR